MKTLTTATRPTAKFDPKNVKHRKMIQQFNDERSWGKLPVTFVLEPEYSDLVTMVQDKMLKFYMAKDRRIVNAPK